MTTIKPKHFAVEQGLRDLYYDPNTGFQSAERLYQKAREEGLKVSRNLVREWLKTQETYTKHKPVIRKHRFRVTFVSDLAYQIQMDLVDMSKFRSENEGHNWILTVIEILSRFAFAVPVPRKDTESMTNAVRRVLDSFEVRFGRLPKVAQFDEGVEFYNVGVRSLLKDKGVSYFSTNSDRKAAIVERFNRTLKTMMWKFFTKEGNHEWLDALPKFVTNYNNTKHRSIGMKPREVSDENKDDVWEKLYAGRLGNPKKPRYKIGDTVRITRYKNVFKKGYEANFTDEIFVIVRVFRGDPTMYDIEDEKGEPILGRFYEEELSETK